MLDDNSTTFDSNIKATTQATAFFDSGLLSVATIEYYINYALIAVGIIGTAANALILYALIVHNARETKKRMVNWLIINQNVIDICSCITIVISVSVRVSSIYLTGALGYILCAIFINENLATCLLNSSVINLVTITIERYLKVVFPFWSKRNLKGWMISVAIVFSWIAGILSVAPLGFVASSVSEGVCQIFVLLYTNPEIRAGYGFYSMASFFVLPLIIFVYCYGHILVVMRKQARVMAGHNVEGSTQSASQAQNKRIKWNIIKTMLIVTAFFTICWFPMNIYLKLVGKFSTSEEIIAYLVMLFLPYVNISLNPFIYSTKHDGVKRILARMIICHRHDDAAAAAGPAAGGSNNTGRTGVKRTNNTGRCQK